MHVWGSPGWFHSEPLQWREQDLLEEVEDMGSGCYGMVDSIGLNLGIHHPPGLLTKDPKSIHFLIKNVDVSCPLTLLTQSAKIPNPGPGRRSGLGCVCVCVWNWVGQGL